MANRLDESTLGKWTLSATRTNLFKGHFLRTAQQPLLPFVKQFRIALSDVIGIRDFQQAGGLVDPARFSFDFAEVADGSFVEDDVAFAIAPLGAEFFVTKRGGES